MHFSERYAKYEKLLGLLNIYIKTKKWKTFILFLQIGLPA